MIKKGIDLSYKVDPYGTEEIVSSAANSCAPILTIDYGDEVQTDAEFTIRPTKGSLDTNISDVASINPIKGNTVAWNQKLKFLENCYGVGCTLSVVGSTLSLTAVEGVGNNMRVEYGKYVLGDVVAGHKYFVCATFKATNSNVINCYLAGSWFGTMEYSANTINHYKRIGTTVNGNNEFGLYPNRRTAFVVGDITEIYNFIFIDLTLIYGAGNEPSTVEAFEADYYKWFGKQLTDEPYSAGELRPVKMNGIKTAGANSSWVSVNPIPVTTLTGKLNGQGSSVVVFPDGMKKAGAVYDEIIQRGGQTVAIKRVGSVDLGTLEWPDIDAMNDRSISSEISDMRNEGWNGAASVIPIYTQQVVASGWGGDDIYCTRTKSFYVRDHSYATGAALKTALSGVIAFYELATPEEYILDPYEVQRMMLGANQVSKIYLGSNLIFEETN